ETPLGVTWSWELPDGTPESASGDTFEFSAEEIDGPTVVDITGSATHPADNREGTAQTQVMVTNVAPTVVAPETVVGECNIPLTTSVKFTDPGIDDTHEATVDWGDTIQEDLGAVFQPGFSADHTYGSVGFYTAHFMVTDDDAGTGSSQMAVDVVDTLPPEVSVAAGPRLLWPPNHEMSVIHVGIAAEDLCDDSVPVLVSVYSNDRGAIKKNHEPDAEIGPDGMLYLRAERDPKKNGRVYLIVIRSTDRSGNLGFDVTSVGVQMNRSADSLHYLREQAVAAEEYVLAHQGTVPGEYLPLLEEYPVPGARRSAVFK
ncbi:hypothetical protein ACFL6N_04085, partial [Thermodesulfobacteriota bacterium]